MTEHLIYFAREVATFVAKQFLKGWVKEKLKKRPRKKWGETITDPTPGKEEGQL